MAKHALAVIVGLALGLVVAAVLLLAIDERSKPVIVIDDPTSDGTIVVAVEGAVASPGIVTLAAGARLHDALAAAGGPAPDADLARINPASRVRDEARIVVPRIGEVAAADGVKRAPTASTSEGDGSGVGPIDGAAPIATAGVAQVSDAGIGEPINLNTASARELEALPEIGPVRAQAIVAYRSEHGAFRTVDELANVPNISPRMVDQMRHLVSVGP